MNGLKFNPLRHSIKVKLLALLLVVLAISTLVVSLASIRTTQILGVESQRISSSALRKQAQSYLVQLTETKAQEYNQTLEAVGKDALLLQATIANLYNESDRYLGQDYWPVSDHLRKGSQGQYANSADEPTSVFVPNTKTLNSSLRRDLELSAYLELVFAPVLKDRPSLRAVYFGTPNEMVRYAPNVNLGQVLQPDFLASERVWFQGSLPNKNPGRNLWWTSPYEDATGLGLITTAAIPVYDQKDTLVGVLGMDLSLNELQAGIENTQWLAGGYSFLVDKNSYAIALPEQGYRDVLGRERINEEINPDLKGATASFAPILQEMVGKKAGFESIVVEGRELFVAFTPLSSTGWSMASVIPAEQVYADILPLQAQLQASTHTMLFNRLLPVIGLVSLLLLIGSLIGLNRLVRPLQVLSAAAQKLASGTWEIGPLPAGQDEIGVLARAFQNMAQQLHDLVTSLEQRVNDRTQDIERRSFHLKVAAEVARESASIRNLEQLLDFVVHLISERFGYSHTGLFLLDDSRQMAVLRAASSEGGQHMLARSHQLKVGAEGIVGYVADKGEPRVALDVGTDKVFFNNPDLPHTRSEAALPLTSGGQVIGVLDVQSNYPSAFQQEDLEVLQILADQVALAIQNTRLLQHSQQALQELEKLYRQQVRENWEQRLEQDPKAYLLDAKGIRTVQTSQSLSPVGGYLLDLSIELRGQRLGTFQLLREGTRGPWQREEIELVHNTLTQIAQAVESARLFEEAQQKVAREEMLNRITANISRSLDTDTLLKTALRELKQLPDVLEVSVHLMPGQGSNSASLPENRGNGNQGSASKRSA